MEAKWRCACLGCSHRRPPSALLVSHWWIAEETQYLVGIDGSCSWPVEAVAVSHHSCVVQTSKTTGQLGRSLASRLSVRLLTPAVLASRMTASSWTHGTSPVAWRLMCAAFRTPCGSPAPLQTARHHNAWWPRAMACKSSWMRRHR